MGAASPQPCKSLRKAESICTQPNRGFELPPPTFNGDCDPQPKSPRGFTLEDHQSPRSHNKYSKLPRRNRDACTPCAGVDIEQICMEPSPGPPPPRYRPPGEMRQHWNDSNRMPPPRYAPSESSVASSYSPSPAPAYAEPAPVPRYVEADRLTPARSLAPEFQSSICGSIGSECSRVPASQEHVYSTGRPLSENEDLSDVLLGRDTQANVMPLGPQRYQAQRASGRKLVGVSNGMEDASDFNSQVENLMARYPDRTRNEIETVLAHCRGHAGRASMAIEGRRGANGVPGVWYGPRPRPEEI